MRPYSTSEYPSLKMVGSKNNAIIFEFLEDFTLKIPSMDSVFGSSRDDDVEAWLTIHKGSRTNLATIPWFLRSFISPIDPIFIMAAPVHDILVGEFKESQYSVYSKDSTVDSPIPYTGTITWKMAADAMLFLMKQSPGKLNYIKARWIYSAIRAYGFIKGLK